jgi:hypothetical protein
LLRWREVPGRAVEDIRNRVVVEQFEELFVAVDTPVVVEYNQCVSGIFEQISILLFLLFSRRNIFELAMGADNRTVIIVLDLSIKGYGNCLPVGTVHFEFDACNAPRGLELGKFGLECVF